MSQIRRPGGGSCAEHADDTHRDYTPHLTEAMVSRLNGRQAPPGRDGGRRWMTHCLVHDDRTPSAVVHDTGDGVMVWCYAGCTPAAIRDALRERGLWPSSRPRRQRTGPDRWPPYTRSLRRNGEVRILTGGDAWEARRRVGIGIILPPGHPPTAHRWPVRGRSVRVIDLTNRPRRTIGYDHPGGDWRQCPMCWAVARRRWLDAWARTMIRRDGAIRVTVVSDAGWADYYREARDVA